jgi:hypothetical protein
MQFALLIFESPEAFATRNADENDPYLGAWRAYYRALVEAGIYVGGNPLFRSQQFRSHGQTGYGRRRKPLWRHLSNCAKLVVKTPPVPNVESSRPVCPKATADDEMTAIATRNTSPRPALKLSGESEPFKNEHRCITVDRYSSCFMFTLLLLLGDSCSSYLWNSASRVIFPNSENTSAHEAPLGALS